MNPTKRFLTAVALGLSCAIAIIGSPVAALLLLLGFEFAMAMPSARIGANSLGTLASSLIIQEALALVFTKRPILKNISLGLRDLDGRVEGANKGQAVITRLRTVPSVTNFGSAASDTADTDVSVTLSNFKQVLYTFTAAELNSTDRNLIAERAEPIATAIANYFVDTISALWTIGNFPMRTGADAVANGATVTKTVKAAGWDYAHLLTVNAVLNKAGVPQMGRFYTGNSDVYASLLSDLRIVAALNNPDNAGAIKSGMLPNVANLGISEYPALPTTGNMVAFAGSPDSTAFAVRPLKDPSAVLPGAPNVMNSGYITEPKSGLTVSVDEWIGTDRSANIRVSWIDGSGVGNANNGQLITTQ